MWPCATRAKYLGQSYSLCRHGQSHPGPVQVVQDHNFMLQLSSTAAAAHVPISLHNIFGPR